MTVNKYGEETTDESPKDKTAAEKICPQCKVALEEVEGTAIFQCPQCGKRPFERF